MPDARRMTLVQSPMIPVVAQLILENPGTISLGQGVVHYGPPPAAFRRVERFYGQADKHKYQDVAGEGELIELIRAKLETENGIAAEPASRIVVTAGGNMAFMNAIFAITDPGDQVILPTPYYFNHEMAIMMADCEPVQVPTDDEYQIDSVAIERAITPRTRAVVTVSPNNPTGAVYREADLRRVNQICRGHGVYHIHDEAYEYFTYDGAEHFSPGSIDGGAGHTISLFSMSKAYGMASWRVGYMVIPPRLLLAVKKAQDTVLICPPVVSQHAAIGAMTTGSAYCRAKLSALTEVRELVLDALLELEQKVSVPKTDGAFYFMVRIDTPMDTMRVVERLIREHGVAVIPGTTFGLSDDCRLRISYGALERPTVAEGIGRFVKGLKKLL